MVGSSKATILLTTLWILAILSLMAIGIGFRTSLELKLAEYQIDSIKARQIAMAGIIKAMNEMEKDTKRDTDTVWECGITLNPDENIEGKFKDIKVGDGHFEVSYINDAQAKVYGIEDLQGKININTASVDVFKRLSSKITDTLANNIAAWRGNQTAGGAGNIDYSDKPYSCKAAFFDSIHELLLVKDFDPAIFYGGQTQDGSGSELGIKDVITVYPKTKDNLKININTANQKVLEALGLGTAAAQIVMYRTGPDGDINKTDDNRVFTMGNMDDYLKDALNDNGTLVATIHANLQKEKTELVCNSSYFRITATGVLDSKKARITKSINCIVKRDPAGNSKPEIIDWFEE